MRGKLGRRARHLQLRRNSLAHHARIFHGRLQDTCPGCTEDHDEPPIQLTAKARSTSVRVHIKPDEFTQLLWGAQSWRRPH